MEVQKLIERAEKKYIKDNSQYQWFDISERPFKTALRFYKRLQVFKANNVVFDPATFLATSYGWWYFTAKIGGKLVFNSYTYSNCTSKHQSKVRRLLEQLGFKIDVTIEAPEGLQDLNSAITHYEYEIAQLKAAIAKPKSRNATNLRRHETIQHLNKQIEIVKELMKDRKNELTKLSN